LAFQANDPSSVINNYMNYSLIYNQLINRAKNRSLTTYLEKHHIIPRCLGGTDDRDNLVEFTPEEHYLAHQLLIKMYPNNPKLVYATWRMTHGNKQYMARNNKMYGWIKRKYINICRGRTGDKNPSYGKRWYYNPETLECKKFSDNEVPQGWFKGRVLKKERYVEKLNRKKRKEQKKEQRKKYAEELFEKFCSREYQSLQEFINAGHYNNSNESLRLMWKKYIPEYLENSSQGKPFKRV